MIGLTVVRLDVNSLVDTSERTTRQMMPLQRQARDVGVTKKIFDSSNVLSVS